MGHNSENCSDDLDHPIRPGKFDIPNCGRYDNGGAAERPYRLCAAQSFNNRSFVKCQPCFRCPPNLQRLSECSATTDTQCFIQSGITELMLTSHQFQTQQVNHQTMTKLFCWATAEHKRRRRSIAFYCLPSDNILYTNQHSQSNKTTAAVNEEVALLQSETSSLEDILSSDLQSAPLQTVLDNLDVLEELVILLDPESPGVKNTSHLASRCSFPATWITYTYSLRESKSPLRAVLEGVTTKHPEWTVGHLARLLREMDRNDTVVVLTKLSLLKVKSNQIVFVTYTWLADVNASVAKCLCF
uniref:IGF-like family receptor 1 n=1 Tax=Oncorhynchus mykiss TaxID=8022 RepID=A0A8C7RVK2_ONCMY